MVKVRVTVGHQGIRILLVSHEVSLIAVVVRKDN